MDSKNKNLKGKGPAKEESKAGKSQDIYLNITRPKGTKVTVELDKGLLKPEEDQIYKRRKSEVNLFSEEEGDKSESEKEENNSEEDIGFGIGSLTKGIEKTTQKKTVEELQRKIENLEQEKRALELETEQHKKARKEIVEQLGLYQDFVEEEYTKLVNFFGEGQSIGIFQDFDNKLSKLIKETKGIVEILREIYIKIQEYLEEEIKDRFTPEELREQFNKLIEEIKEVEIPGLAELVEELEELKTEQEKLDEIEKQGNLTEQQKQRTFEITERIEEIAEESDRITEDFYKNK